MEHYLRRAIMTTLLFSEGVTFSQLRPSSTIRNNSLYFHIKHLIADGYIEKENNLYKLTKKERLKYCTLILKYKAKKSRRCVLFGYFQFKELKPRSKCFYIQEQNILFSDVREY